MDAVRFTSAIIKHASYPYTAWKKHGSNCRISGYELYSVGQHSSGAYSHRDLTEIRFSFRKEITLSLILYRCTISSIRATASAFTKYSLYQVTSSTHRSTSSADHVLSLLLASFICFMTSFRICSPPPRFAINNINWLISRSIYCTDKKLCQTANIPTNAWLSFIVYLYTHVLYPERTLFKC